MMNNSKKRNCNIKILVIEQNIVLLVSDALFTILIIMEE